MLDPATVDITGRILEMLATYGYDKDHPAAKRAIAFIRKEQEPDGSWFGRWGVNYIYGTALVLRGLEAIGMDLHEPCVQQAAEWLRRVQNADGGWGETVGSYDDPTLPARTVLANCPRFWLSPPTTFERFGGAWDCVLPRTREDDRG
jgi:squalene-hopene/tetraprenyl-beta-curcumene cyclase